MEVLILVLLIACLVLGFLLSRKPKEVIVTKEIIKEVQAPTQSAEDLQKEIAARNKIIEEAAVAKTAELERQHQERVKELSDTLLSYAATEVEMKSNLETLAAKLQELHEAENQIVKEWEIRKMEADEMAHFSINIPDEDLKEMEILQNLARTSSTKLSHALKRAAYDVFVSIPLAAMIKRVVTGKMCGIYKITNIETQQCYIGQAVDIGDRWKTHVKRVIGLEVETQNKLYPAMRAAGIENFRFTVVELVPKEKLRERELYWQEYYNAVSFGYSLK